ncbi:MAG: hypothetical protein ACLT5F_09355 [Anaerotignaceae bacterium]
MGEGSTNQKELKLLTLKQLFLPLPSYKEQEHIIRLITELFSKMSKIEKALDEAFFYFCDNCKEFVNTFCNSNLFLIWRN